METIRSTQQQGEARPGGAALAAAARSAVRALAAAAGGAAAAGTRHESRRLLPVLLPVVFVGAAVTAAAAVKTGVRLDDAAFAAGLGAMLVAALLAEFFPLPIEGVEVGKMSLASIFVVATAVLYGWDAGAVVAAATMVVVEVARRRPPSRVAYNASLYAIPAALAGIAAARIPGDSPLADLALGALAGSAVFYVLNLGLLTVIVARTRRAPFFRLLGRYLYSTAGATLVVASFTITLVILWDRSPPLVAVLAVPLVAIALYQRWLHGALDRLRELDRLRDEFVAVVSHELRTPLTSVYGAAMTMQREEVDDELRASLLSVIFAESARLARLVDQVLVVSGLESGRVRPEIVTADPVLVAREIVDAARAQLTTKHTLALIIRDPLPPVAADPERVKQVLSNLIENAAKYSPEGGPVEVALAARDGYVTFSVRDQGLGIPPEEHERVFEKFHRLDPNLTRGVAGTGLGLYICRELVGQMNGTIWVESSPGSGSTFSFSLPVANPPA
jgi:signal transduction histidine kinase